jgi:hypothetical protein
MHGLRTAVLKIREIRKMELSATDGHEEIVMDYNRGFLFLFLWTVAIVLIGIAIPEQVSSNDRPASSKDWGIAYGSEFWRSLAHELPDAKSQHAVKSRAHTEINIGDAIERVTFAIQKDRPHPELNTKTYRVKFDQAGIDLSVLPPADLVAKRGVSLQTKDGMTVSHNQTKSMTVGDVQTHFRTISVKVGDHYLHRRENVSVDWSIVGNTAQVLLDNKTGLVEHIETRPYGIAVTWVLSQRPESKGPLLIDTELSGLSFAGESEAGHHFTDETGIPRIRVSRVYVVDASGMRWDVPSEAVGDNRLQISIAEEILSSATYPLAVDPIISPEFGMDQIVPVPSFGDQAYPELACNDTVCLVVWGDALRIRVSDGQILDPWGLPGHFSITDYHDHSVATNGVDFLVAWTWGYHSILRTDIRGRIVTGDGSVSEEFNITNFPDWESNPSVSSDGTDFFVAWEQGWTSDIKGTRIMADGTIVDAIPIDVSAGAHREAKPSVAFSNGNYLVVWEDNRNHLEGDGWDFDVYGARVAPSDGEVLDPTGFEIWLDPDADAGYKSPSVAASSDNFLIYWYEDSKILGARVRASDGLVLDLSPIVISGDDVSAWGPAASSNGSDFLVAFTEFPGTNFNIKGKWVRGSDGAVLSPSSFPINTSAGHQNHPSIAYTGSGFLVVWQDGRHWMDFDDDIFGARLDATGAVLDGEGFLVSASGNDQGPYAVASNGEIFLVVWSDERGLTSLGDDIYGVRIDTQTGAVLDPMGFEIGRSSRDYQLHSVASNGDGFLVVWMFSEWQQSSGLYQSILAGRVAADGQILDASPIKVSVSQPFGPSTGVYPDSPEVASNGSDYLVVWHDARQYPYDNRDIYGARVSSLGAVLDPDGIPISLGGSKEHFADVSSDGIDYFVVWTDQRNDAISAYDIYGTRIQASTGLVLDPSGIALSNADFNQMYPAISFNGDVYLAAWRDVRHHGDSYDWDVYATRVDPFTADVLDPDGVPILTTGTSSGLDVASDGKDFFVAWSDNREGWSVYGTKVRGLDASVSDLDGFPISDGAGPKLAFDSVERFLVVYGISNNDADAYRVVGRFVSFGNLPPVANNQVLLTQEDTATAITQTATDPESDLLTISIHSHPSHGTLADTGASWSYDPDENFCGSDSFTFQAHDGQLNSNVATVSIDVVCVNDPPAVSTDQSVVIVDEGDPATMTGTASDVEGDSVSLAASVGTVLSNGDGTWSWGSTTDDGTTDSQTVTISAVDGNGGSTQTSFGLSVNNVAPTASFNAPASVNEGSDIVLSLTSPFDPSSADTTTGFQYAFDCGTGYGAFGSSSASCLTTDNEVRTVGAKIRDKDGGETEYTASVTVANLPPVVSTIPTSQIVQYSDEILEVSVTATDGPSDTLTIATSWRVGGEGFSAGLPANLSLALNSCSVNGQTTCIWTLSGIVDVPAGIYAIRFTVEDGDGGQSTETTVVTVEPEDASIEFDSNNPVAMRVAEPGEDSGPFSLIVYVHETVPDTIAEATYPGDIGQAQVSMSLQPVGPGGAKSGTCVAGAVTGDGYNAILAVTCSFNEVPVNTYSAVTSVAGGYYVGMGEDVLTVYDPSLGFAGCGGWFYWPGTTDKTNFGCTMKYNKKATKVQGNLLLIRHLSDGSIFRVKSNALFGLAVGEVRKPPPYGWATFNGKATYLEPGWSEPKGSHEFVVYIEDRDDPGEGTDRFWIEVMDKQGEPVPLSISRDAQTNAEEIGGGNIVVPHSGK